MKTPLPSVEALHPNLRVREAAEALSRHVEANPGINATQLVQGMPGGDERDWWRAKRLLVENGYIENRDCGDCNAHHYFSAARYRIDTDPDAEGRPSLIFRIEAAANDIADTLVAYGRCELRYETGSLHVVFPDWRLP